MRTAVVPFELLAQRRCLTTFPVAPTGSYTRGMAQHRNPFGGPAWQLVRLHGVVIAAINQWCSGTLALVFGPKSML
jgi:hypothetical protein